VPTDPEHRRIEARRGARQGGSVTTGAGARAGTAQKPGPAAIDPEDDARIIAALRAQDPSVADPLWRRFGPEISSLLRRVLGPRMAIDEAVQVVLLCVFRRGRRLRPGADLGRFIVKATTDIARGELRRPRLRRPPSARARAERASAPRDAASESVRRFYRLLDRLDAADRIAFVLHYIDGLDPREVTAALGASPAATNRRLHRSLDTVLAGIERDPVLRRMRQPLLV